MYACMVWLILAGPRKDALHSTCMHMHTQFRLKLVVRNREDSETTDLEPANLPQMWGSLLISLIEKFSGKAFASRDTNIDKGTIHVQSSQGHVTDQGAVEIEGDGPTTSNKDGYASSKSNASNSRNDLEDSLSNAEYREPMIAS